MDIGTLRGISTLIALIAFLVVVWWAYGARKKDAFDAAAHMPLEEDPVNREDK